LRNGCHTCSTGCSARSLQLACFPVIAPRGVRSSLIADPGFEEWL
jgi:hypothetical protein